MHFTSHKKVKKAKNMSIPSREVHGSGFMQLRKDVWGMPEK
jgi:hypothetical protein